MPPSDPMLSSLIEEALSKNPEVRAARQLAEAESQRPAQARSLAPPMVSVDYTNDGWAPSLGEMPETTLGLMASQDLPYPGKRRLRGEIASREAARVAQQAERVSRGIAASVKRAYYGLLLSRQLLDLVADQEAVWRQIEGVARARYAVGQGAQQDVLRVQVEVTRIEELRAEQEGEAQIRLAEVNRLLDRPVDAAVETPGRLELRPLAAGLDELVAWAIGACPEIRGAELAQESASLGVELAHKEFKPDFSVRGAYMNRGSLPPMWQAGVGFTLPVYRKRLAAGAAEAEARAGSTRSAAEALRLALRYRTQERLTQLRTTERLAALYSEGILPQDGMSMEAALANYQTGQVPFIAVLEALTTLYNDRAKHLQLLAGHEQTLASLEEASLEATSAMPTGGGMGGVGGSSLAMPAGGRSPAGGGTPAMAGSSGMGNE